MSSRVSPKNVDHSLRAAYDRGAEQYDRVRYHSYEGRYFSELEVELLKRWLTPGPHTTVLDVPAGTGRLSGALAETGATVVGVDISAKMLRMAAAKRAADAGRRVHFSQGSGAELPFADNAFDAVISFKFFHLIPNDRKPLFIREMVRVLKPGKSLIVEFNSPYYGGVFAWFRYHFRKQRPGAMRTKCIFPDQIPGLFDGLHVARTHGVKLPFFGLLSRFIGWRATSAMDLAIGRLPIIKYLTYAIVVEARKPAVLDPRHSPADSRLPAS